MNNISKRLKKIFGISTLIVVFITSLFLSSSNVQAQTKTYKNVGIAPASIILILNDGTPAAPGTTVPYSKLNGSYYMLANPVAGMSYGCFSFCNPGNYVITNSIDVSCAYENILTQPTNKTVIDEYTEAGLELGWTVLPITTAVPIPATTLVGFSNATCDTLCVFAQEIGSGAMETMNQNVYNFKVDKTK